MLNVHKFQNLKNIRKCLNFWMALMLRFSINGSWKVLTDMKPWNNKNVLKVFAVENYGFNLIYNTFLFINYLNCLWFFE